MKNKDQECLEYLSGKMEATAKMVGEHLFGSRQTSYATRCAAAILGRLRKDGLVTHLSELNAWRLTKEGRIIGGQMRNEEFIKLAEPLCLLTGYCRSATDLTAKSNLKLWGARLIELAANLDNAWEATSRPSDEATK